MKLKTIHSDYYGVSRTARIITAPKAAARIRNDYANARRWGRTSLEQVYCKASHLKWRAMRAAHNISAAASVIDGDKGRHPTCFIDGVNTFAFTVYWSTSAGVYKLTLENLYFVPNT